MQTLDYQSARNTTEHRRRGMIASRLAVWCAAASLVLTAIGVPFESDSDFLSARQIASLLVLALAWFCGFVACILSMMALIRSAGRRGWLSIVSRPHSCPNPDV
jgi:hypothetical protein